MEIYRDLTEFYQLKAGKTLPNVVDELNTPIFEKTHFDYDRQLHSSDLLNVITSKEDQPNYQVKVEVPNMDLVHINDVNNILIQENCITSENTDINITSVDKDADEILNYVVLSSQGINSNQSNTHPLDNSEYEYIYHDSNKVTPLLKELVSEDDEYLPTVNNYSDIFLNNNDDGTKENVEIDNTSIDLSDQYIILNSSPIESLEVSKSSIDSSYNYNPFNLHLDCSKIKQAESLNTPDVIETIDAIELEKGFNILNFITEDNCVKTEPAVALEELSSSSSSSLSNDCSTTVTVPKQTRKRKIEDDDDDDYEPPLSFFKQFPSSQHARSDFNFENTTKPARRGRPPKKASATSAKVCLDEDVKYREMRDKNNEASRKSRLKRRIKEVAQEEEADELIARNIKLKAQVAELERTVNNFRTNLMQILMKK